MTDVPAFRVPLAAVAALCGVIALLAGTDASRATADGCAVILKTSDGFLAVREGPGTTHREIGRVEPGQIVITDHLDDFEFAGEWWPIRAVMEYLDAEPAPLRGWIYGKYAAPVNC